MNKQVLYALVNETVRHYGAAEPDHTPKIVKRIRRKFKTKLAIDAVSKLVSHYQSVYAFAASILKDCLLPPTGE